MLRKMKIYANIIISRLFCTHDECPTHFLTSHLYPDPACPGLYPLTDKTLLQFSPEYWEQDFVCPILCYLFKDFFLEREEGREKERERSIDV